MVTRPNGAVQVVIGLGINRALPEDASVGDDWPRLPISLAEICRRPPTLNDLAGQMLCTLGELLLSYPETGFAPYLQLFHQVDALRDVDVVLDHGGAQVNGKARGVDAQGALLLEIEGRIQPITAGEVRVRGVT